ncbi:MAG: alpha/beta fold hydrolase [Burkholderiales bacterium]|nr:alpha/beta fold hydrolase [Burkholderiales bacterium]
MPRSRLAALCLALVASVLAAGCGNDAAGRRSLSLAPCRLPNVAMAAQCGELEVAEDRARPEGRRIRIFAAVLPANTVSPKQDPLLLLAGGPGQAASFLGPFAMRLTELRRTRDVVLIDQRGTGRSSPLSCDAFAPRDDDVFETDPLPRGRDCVAQLRAQGVDPAQYTTTAWIADVEAVRVALGYARWNLWGGSYGTRVAQEYLRRHPERVRTVILDGVAPPEMVITLDVWRTRAAALTAIFDACANSAACRTAHPDVAATLDGIEQALGPTGREIDLMDPSTGAIERRRVTFDIVLAVLQPLTYAPETASLLPQMLVQAAHGDFGALFAANPMLSGNLAEQMNAALHFSVTCAEDVPRIKAGSDARMLAGLPTRRLALQSIAVCGVWPRGRMPGDFADAVHSDKPALLFSGGMDPVTPPAYGAQVLQGLTNGRHIVAPGYGHIVSVHACAPRLIAAFVDAAGFDKLPPTCVAHFENSVPPPLWPNRLGPQP